MAWTARPSPELRSIDDVEATLMKDLRTVVAEEVGESVPVTCNVVRGQAAGTLVDRAGRDDVVAVATGARGGGGFAGLDLGSVTRQLADHTPRPLVVVRDTERPPRLARMVVAVDGSRHSRRALQWAADLAAVTDGEVTVVHALAPPTWEYEIPLRGDGGVTAAQQVLAECSGPLEERGIRHRTVVVEGDPRTVVPDLADEVDADLVVAGTRGRTGIETVLLGSVATYLLHHERRPLALVPSA